MRAISLGVDTRALHADGVRDRLGLGGIAGALYAPLVQFIDPTPFALALSLNLLLMVVVGGSGYFFGPFLGAVVAVLLPEWLRFAEGYYLIVYAAFVMVLMVFCPTGLLGLLERRLRDRSPAAHAGRRDAANTEARMSAGPRSPQPQEQLRRHPRGRRRVVRRERGRDPRHHRAERLRQVDAVQLHPRPAAARPRARCSSTAAPSPACGPATSTGSASAAPSSCCRSFRELDGAREPDPRRRRSTRARCSSRLFGRARRRA